MLEQYTYVRYHRCGAFTSSKKNGRTMCPGSQRGRPRQPATHGSCVTTRSTSTTARVRSAWSTVNEIRESKGAWGACSVRSSHNECGPRKSGKKKAKNGTPTGGEQVGLVAIWGKHRYLDGIPISDSFKQAHARSNPPRSSPKRVFFCLKYAPSRYHGVITKLS